MRIAERSSNFKSGEQLLSTDQNKHGRFFHVGVAVMRYAIDLEAGDTTIGSSGFAITVADSSAVNLGQERQPSYSTLH